MYGLGRYNQAIEVLSQAIITRAAQLGDNHPSTMALRIDLANVLAETGNNKQALAIFERTLREA